MRAQSSKVFILLEYENWFENSNIKIDQNILRAVSNFTKIVIPGTQRLSFFWV